MNSPGQLGNDNYLDLATNLHAKRAILYSFVQVQEFDFPEEYDRLEDGTDLGTVLAENSDCNGATQPPRRAVPTSPGALIYVNLSQQSCVSAVYSTIAKRNRLFDLCKA